MKKSKFWLTSLSLSQQLIFIIISFLSFFAIFFFLYINTNVMKYTEREMFNQLAISQNTIQTVFDASSNLDFEELSHINDKQSVVTSYFYQQDRDGDFHLASAYNESEIIPGEELQEQIKYNLYLNTIVFQEGNINKGLISNYSFSSDKNFTYYSLSRLDDHTYVVSLLKNSYIESFKSHFQSNVMDITIFVVGMFFLIMLLWVSSIIRPLNHIRNYIEKIKSGKQASLKISREDEIGEVASALVEMQEEIAKQEKVKEEMIHNISHDLKTPIATIKSYSESIKDGIYPYDTLEKSVDVIIDNANRLEKKVYSLLFLNRVEYLLNQDSSDTFCDMKEVVSTVILNTKVIRPEIEIESNLTTSMFKGNDEAWRVCIENILENALRYAKTQIVITLDEEQLSIYNDGPDIEEDRLESLFKPYEKGEGGQFGLGLSIVNKVVSANKCSIVAENVETGGVIFIICKEYGKEKKTWKQKNSH